MDAIGIAGRRLVRLAVVVVLAGCASGGGQTPAPATPAPASVPPEAVATPAPAATATVRPTPTVTKTADVAYESTNPLLVPGVLDVFAPTKAGPWPVVVMLHGSGVDKGTLTEGARRVAELGFVVFNATWGGSALFPDQTSERWLAFDSQGACAVAFARAHAAEYGGDPATMIVFGHSWGANIGAMVAFARPVPSAGCLGGTTLGAIDALVTWEGDWIVSVAADRFEDALAADSRVLDAATPWRYLAQHKDLKVVLLVSDDPGAPLEREVGDPWAADSWLAVRDPSGDLRRQLEANGAFADGIFDFVDGQQLLYSVLKAQGNPVSLDVMPGSSHIFLSAEGMKVFLAAFSKEAKD